MDSTGNANMADEKASLLSPGIVVVLLKGKIIAGMHGPSG
jgi:hypothetical protein